MAIVLPVAIDRSTVRPTVEDVAALERTRTVEGGGNEVGTFTDDTVPSAEEVDTLIDVATDEVLSQLRDLILPGRESSIRNLITLLTATKLEASYFKEQGGGAAQVWERLYNASLMNVRMVTRTGIVY